MDNTKKKFLEILDKSRGIILTACKSMDISRQTYYNWLKSDEDFKQSAEDIQENAIDFVESKLLEKINGITIQVFNQKGEPVVYDQQPSDTAIIFFLKTKGKKRGYIERVEVDNVSPIQLLINDPLDANSDNDSTSEDIGS
jgi:hypothetical protein